jgi:hypothetical protein
MKGFECKEKIYGYAKKTKIKKPKQSIHSRRNSKIYFLLGQFLILIFY